MNPYQLCTKTEIEACNSDNSSHTDSDIDFNVSLSSNRFYKGWSMPTFKHFPPGPVTRDINTAFEDSFYYAWHGYDTADTTDIFKRYFKDGDGRFVRQVFTEMFEAEMLGPSPTFSDMTIIYGGEVGSREEARCKKNSNTLAYLEIFSDDPDSEADLIVCPRAMLLPLIHDTHCDMLSDHIDWTFNSLGAVLLHEYIHWPKLMRRALQLKDPPLHVIFDFKGPDPENGYGPFNVMEVREKAEPTENADNYRWLATEAYWHRVCRPALPQYGPGRKAEKWCDTENQPDLDPQCHPI